MARIANIVFVINGKLRKARIQVVYANKHADSEEEQRHIAETDLESSEEMGRFVIDSAMDGIIITREDGEITLWNPSAAKKFGWTSEEAVGRSLSEMIVPTAGRDEYSAGLQKFLETSEASVVGNRLEMIGLAKDGREFPIELSIAQHDVPDGQVFIGFVRDISEQRKLNQRLRQAQKMEAMGTLASGVAHDFNNVLAAISGNVVLAREDAESTPECLREIDKSVATATGIVRQILTFSHVTEPNSQVLDIGPVLQHAVLLLKATIPSTMHVDCLVVDGLPPVLLDATDIHQIVLNLGINAFQALNGQTGKFEVRVTQIVLDAETAKNLMGLSPGNYVRLSFGDTGCGMDAKTMQRLFEPFFTTKPVGEGTGLGLAVVYGIVSRHGGAITPYSEPNHGTVFHIYLPAAKPGEVHDIAAATAPKVGNGERILYVDDDEALVFMMKRLLGKLNYKVDGFSDPAEALAVFRNNPCGFDLVITDMSMPFLNGPALVGELRAIRAGIPIVMVTGYIRPADLEQATNLGIDELILKPNTIQEMSEVLHRVLSHKHNFPISA
jgi:PAS domain S-box-containing protein